jgi:hypothetical protein
MQSQPAAQDFQKGMACGTQALRQTVRCTMTGAAHLNLIFDFGFLIFDGPVAPRTQTSPPPHSSLKP